jgi:AcrR family transcriptional regulator
VTDDRRRAQGRRTRGRLLDRAAAAASERGLEGLSIARLADDVGLSKSGVAALYGSKEALQLATVAHARDIFVREVVAPVWDRQPGLPRLRALISSWIDYVGGGVFPGGCFLQHCLAEQANRPGALRDALAASRTDWLALLAQEIGEARRRGELAPQADPPRLAFEVEGLLAAGNRGHVLADADALRWAAAACEERISALVADPGPESA